jgi:hypothetical protein
MRRPASALLLLAALPACSGGRVTPVELDVATRPGETVAAVNGRPITAARLAAHARATTREVPAALTDLIGFELLTQEAARRGLTADPEVQETRKSEMVRRFLQVEFEARHRPEDIPEAELREQYERNRRHFDHPELRNVVSALFAAKRGQATAAEEGRARAKAQELFERLRAEQPKDAATAKQIIDVLGGGVPLRVDHFNTWPGADADRDWLKAALALRRPGQISEPVRSKYGWHVIYLAELDPEKRTPQAEAFATVRREMHPLWQRAAFGRFIDEVQARHAVTTSPELIATRAPGAAAGAKP